MSNSYTITIVKSGPEHWVVNTILNVNPYKMEVVVGGTTIREGIINAIDALNKKLIDADTFELQTAIRDLESIL